MSHEDEFKDGVFPAWMEAHIAEEKKRGKRNRKNPTFGEIARAYLAAGSPGGHSEDVARLIEVLGDVRVDQLTPDAVREKLLEAAEGERSNTKLIRVVVDVEMGEVVDVLLSDEFDKLYPIIQADLLKDLLRIVQGLYEKHVDEAFNGTNQPARTCYDSEVRRLQ